jgi:curved DNA-binding protein
MTQRQHAMDFKNYYKTLGVAHDASSDEIKKAFRKLARKFHPDVSKEPNAEQRMKEINEAYGVLSDPEKRAAYDHPVSGAGAGTGHGPPSGWDSADGPGYSGSTTESEFFANLFGQAARQRQGFKMRGDDRHASISIDLADAYTGAQRALLLRMPRLNADGSIVSEERTLQVQIPKGVREGQHMRLAGQGMPGIGGAEAGDLFLEVHFVPSMRYRVEGRDVYQKLPVAPWEAAIGADITVATPAGTIQVSVPASSQGGRKLRLKGRGIPGDPPGDLYLVLDLVLPPVTTEQQRQLYADMARVMAFNPRQEMGA